MTRGQKLYLSVIYMLLTSPFILLGILYYAVSQGFRVGYAMTQNFASKLFD